MGDEMPDEPISETAYRAWVGYREPWGDWADRRPFGDPAMPSDDRCPSWAGRPLVSIASAKEVLRRAEGRPWTRPLAADEPMTPEQVEAAFNRWRSR